LDALPLRISLSDAVEALRERQAQANPEAASE
jgi:hypothetical protein